MAAALRRRPGVDAALHRRRQPVGARRRGEATRGGTPVRDVSRPRARLAVSRATTFGLGDIARGYESEQDVWAAVRKTPGLAVVDSTIVPRRDSWNFGVLPDFQLTGFYFEEGFDPIPIQVLDKQTGSASGSPSSASSRTRRRSRWSASRLRKNPRGGIPGSDPADGPLLRARAGVDPDDAAAGLEAAFLASGLEAESIQQVVDDTLAANVTFNRLIQGFMGLGLLVGVAALGVISARAVVERRQQIGVMRAIGFRTRMVQAAFLLESSFIALTSIVVGTALGLLLAWNIIRDTRSQPSWRISSSSCPG